MKANPKMSNAGRWTRCAASVSLEAQYPAPPTPPETEEGRVAHKDAADCLTGDENSANPDVQVYLDDIRKHQADEHGTETKVKWLGMTVYVDHWEYHEGTDFLAVWDYKNGRRSVDAVGNMQMLCYAGALARQFPNLRNVVMTIVQPRAWHRDGTVRRWRMAVDELNSEIEDLVRAHAATSAKGAKACTGSHCRYCRALPGCYSATEAAAVAIDVTEAPYSYPIDPRQVEAQYEILLKAEEAIILKTAAMKSYLTQRATEGKMRLKGYELRAGKGKTRWKDNNQVLKFGPIFGIDLAVDPKPVGIGEAKKRGLTDAMISKLTHKPAGAVKLVKAIDYGEIFKNG